MCYRRSLAAFCAILACLWAQWRTEIFYLEILREGPQIISHYIKIPFDRPERHSFFPDAEAKDLNLEIQGKCPPGWFVLPGTVAELNDASQTTDARAERPRKNASVEAGNFDDVACGLKMCKNILEKVILEKEEIIRPRILKTELLLCHGSIQKFIEREADLDGKPLSRRQPCLYPRVQLEKELKRVCSNLGYSDLHARSNLPVSEVYGDPHANQGFEVHQRRIQESDVSPKSPFDPRKDNIKITSDKDIYRDQQACEDTVCPASGLEKICASGDRNPKKEKKAMCKMCYPKKNNALIREHCTRRRRQEARAFYILCALLIAAIATAVFLVLLRNLRRRTRKRSNIGLSKQIRKTSVRHDNASGSFERTGLKSQISLVLRRLFSKPKRETADPSPGDTFDDTESSTPKIFTFQRWNGFGLFTKGPRKRLQDVFDLESLKSTKGTLNDGMERVPVLPRARKDSVHLSLTEMNTGPTPRESYADEIRLSNGHFATIHTTHATQRAGMVPETSRSVQ